MTLDETIAAVLFRCEQRLGHLGKVKVLPRDHDYFLGVALFLYDQPSLTHWACHGVTGTTNDAMADPVAFADAAADKLLAWHSRRASGELDNEHSTS